MTASCLFLVVCLCVLILSLQLFFSSCLTEDDDES